MKERAQQHRGLMVALPYFDLLGKPLTLKELRRYLWGVDLDIERLREVAKPWRIGEVYGLRPVSESVRAENVMRVEYYWRWVKAHRWVLSWVPFVSLVMVMNGLAHGEVNEESDIDLFVVAKRGRVWLARGWMLVLLTVFGLRAKGARKAMRFAPEFFVDEEHTNLWGVGSDSIYMNSFWLADFTPILYQQNFDRFRKANSWLAAYMPVAWRSPRVMGSSAPPKPLVTQGLEKILSGRLGDKIEAAAAARQRAIIERNLELLGERPDYRIDEHVIKIHFRSNRPRVVEDKIAAFLVGSD